MTEGADQKRRLELLCAAVISIALAVLTALLTKLSVNNKAIPIVTEISAPIVVFPDFASISDTEARKQQFFDFLQDYVRAQNQNISDLRQQLSGHAAIVDRGSALSDRERGWLFDLASAYYVDTRVTSDSLIIDELLLRVDVIPASLVMAQAANESAWGTSRFALEGNNILGQWCYEVGCGIVPSQRVVAARHEVKRFDSIGAAIEGYFLNINTHRAYNDLRKQRALLRKRGMVLDPILLARGLHRYSQRGEDYVDEVQTLIQQNNLEQRDTRWLEN